MYMANIEMHEGFPITFENKNGEDDGQRHSDGEGFRTWQGA